MPKRVKEPYKVTLEKDKIYMWCQCGASKNQPFCDGSHEAYFCEPMIVTEKETKEVHLCGCKESGNKPYCDGTHKTLEK